MSIDWVSLGKVAGVGLVFGVGIVVVFAVGLLGVSRAEGAVERGSAHRAGGLALAGVCFAVCAAAVAYGIVLLVPQWH